MDLDILHQDILSALPSDPIATKHISIDGQWSMDPNSLLDNRIYVLSAGNLHTCILQYNHDHILARYFGQNKTLELVHCRYSWPSLCADVQQFYKSCVTCMQSKPQCHKPYRSLKQLPIPERPWNSISMDFIKKLLSFSGFDTILVIVDQLTKQAIFIPAHDTITSTDLAHLFILHVFSKHGIPSHVTSDRGSEFVSNFFQSLGTALDMRLYFTSGYHPKDDGQTKCMNQTLEQYLHVYCNYQQDNWSELLPLAEFAYNNAPSTTTGVSPFFANKGYHLNITVHPKRDIASFQAHNFAIDLDELQNTLKAEISAAQQCYQKSTDVRCSSAPDFKGGDKVFVKAQFFQTTWPSKKLSKKYLGPYKIISQPSTLLFTLHLPESICSVHPVFHVSMLEPATSNTFSERIQPVSAPVIIDGEPEYEISQIVDSKINHQRACKLLYKVIWLGYEDTGDKSK